MENNIFYSFYFYIKERPLNNNTHKSIYYYLNLLFIKYLKENYDISSSFR